MKSTHNLKSETARRLYFDDDCPRLGSGMRYCDIKVGRKWVYITDRANGNRVKLRSAQAFVIIVNSIKRETRYGQRPADKTRCAV
jgi:hypothetical protein